MADHTSILYDEARLRAYCRKNDREGIYDPKGDMLDTLDAFVAISGDLDLGYDYEEDIRPAIEWAAEQHAKRFLVLNPSWGR